jgi:hypothetical protein
MTAQATLAVDISGAFGFVIQYPVMPGPLHGEYRDELPFLDAIEALLQNGFAWRVLLALPELEDRDPTYLNRINRASGALWYLAAKHGAAFSEVVSPAGVTDGQLNKARLWRRGMSAANRAARLLMPEGTTE